MEQPKLGIAVVTYRRPERLERLLTAIEEQTESPYELVVAEDGAEDGAVELARERGVRVVTGPNRGVCWNKNRGLFALLTLGCDTLLLLEDDIFPAEPGWEREWVAATQRWDHLAFAHPKIDDFVVSGSGTAEDPFVNRKATAQCTAVSARAMEAAGFLDSRFKGYGVGHAEWTTRIKRAGMGFSPVELEDGRKAKANLYIRGGLEPEDAESHRDNDQVRANQELFSRIKHESVYRHPWSSAEERETFLAEQADAGLEALPRWAPEWVEPAEPLAQPPEVTPRARPKPVAEPHDVVVNTRGHKWDEGDLFAMEAMRPLAGRGYIPWTSFSLRPAALMTIVNEVKFRKPDLVVECGGGASTFYLARLLQLNGHGRVVTIENDGPWSEALRAMLADEGLSDVSEIVHAPLADWSEDEESAARSGAADSELEVGRRWYDTAAIDAALGDTPIDVLFVDGPPGSRTLNRYPAVPVLADRLADDAVIFLDDANRPAEAESARRWGNLLGVRFTVYRRMSLAVGRRGGGFTLLGT